MIKFRNDLTTEEIKHYLMEVAFTLAKQESNGTTLEVPIKNKTLIINLDLRFESVKEK